MAMAKDTVSGLACFYAILAFSSLHRYGINEQAMQLKVKAIQSLSASVAGEPAASAQTAQHIAASMLLGAFEVSYRVKSIYEIWRKPKLIVSTRS
jgi:hypothetical protein